jgi:D-glycero-D-manno-heptose 1,7-bisphosphate phosphatase
MTSDFLARTPTIFLDRDGVLNKKMPRAQYVCSWKDWSWLPGAKEALTLLKEAGYRVILITNQPGIARGFMTEEDLSAIHQKMIEEVRSAGGEIFAIYHCPHGWDDGCECRKPSPGMLFQAQRDFHLDLTRTYFVGDDIRDKQAGLSAGSKTILLSTDFQLCKAIDTILSDVKL